jgi:cobalamin biosynthesis Mg chelatase CobN
MPASYTPTAHAAPKNVILYIILGALFLIALFLVVFFAMRS